MRRRSRGRAAQVKPQTVQVPGTNGAGSKTEPKPATRIGFSQRSGGAGSGHERRRFQGRAAQGPCFRPKEPPIYGCTYKITPFQRCFYVRTTATVTDNSLITSTLEYSTGITHAPVEYSKSLLINTLPATQIAPQAKRCRFRARTAQVPKQGRNLTRVSASHSVLVAQVPGQVAQVPCANGAGPVCARCRFRGQAAQVPCASGTGFGGKWRRYRGQAAQVSCAHGAAALSTFGAILERPYKKHITFYNIPLKPR